MLGEGGGEGNKEGERRGGNAKKDATNERVMIQYHSMQGM